MQPEIYTVCRESQIVDPLILLQYWQKKGVFAAKDGMEADAEAYKIAKWAACTELEEYYGIKKKTAWDRRHTKRSSKYLPLTTETPKWMRRWIEAGPSVVDDGRENEIQIRMRLREPLTLHEMFKAFTPRERWKRAKR